MLTDNRGGHGPAECLALATTQAGCVLVTT